MLLGRAGEPMELRQGCFSDVLLKPFRATRCTGRVAGAKPQPYACSALAWLLLLHIASKVFCPSCFCRRAPIAGRESQGVALVLGEQELVRHGMVWAQMRACVLATGAGVCTWHPDPKHSNLQCRTRICVL